MMSAGGADALEGVGCAVGEVDDALFSRVQPV